MKKAVNVVADNFNTMRTGRANPAILDRIQVSNRSLKDIVMISSNAADDSPTVGISKQLPPGLSYRCTSMHLLPCLSCNRSSNSRSSMWC